MNKKRKTVFGSLKFVIFSIVISFIPNRAVLADLCEAGYVFAYFNGVLTSRPQAESALRSMKKLYGTEYNGQPVEYQLLYNSTNGLEDFVETFDQRMEAHIRIADSEGLSERYELYFPTGSSSWWDAIVDSDPNLEILYEDLQQYIAANMINGITSLLADPPTLSTYNKHLSKVENWVADGKKILFVAHSQGNLYMDSAYRATRLIAEAGSYKGVHIAPASPTLIGEYTLADHDLVINVGLRAIGRVPSATTEIPNYLSREPGLDGETDFLGHGLLEIYLSPTLQTSQRIRGHIEDALRDLKTSSVGACVWEGGYRVDIEDCVSQLPDGDYGTGGKENACQGGFKQNNSRAYGDLQFSPNEAEEFNFQRGSTTNGACYLDKIPGLPSELEIGSAFSTTVLDQEDLIETVSVPSCIGAGYGTTDYRTVSEVAKPRKITFSVDSKDEDGTVSGTFNIPKTFVYLTNPGAFWCNADYQFVTVNAKGTWNLRQGSDKDISYCDYPFNATTDGKLTAP